MRVERDREPARAICIVLHDLSGGGTERIAIRLANRWAQMGRRVRLICGCDRRMRTAAPVTVPVSITARSACR